MLNIQTKGFLLNIFERCKRIEEKTNILNEESFMNNDDAKDIICYNLLIISEIIKTLQFNIVERKTRKIFNDIGDKITHDYENLDFKRVWSISINDIKLLREYCEQIVNE